MSNVLFGGNTYLRNMWRWGASQWRSRDSCDSDSCDPVVTSVNNIKSKVGRFDVDGEAAGKCLTVCEWILDPNVYSHWIYTFGDLDNKVVSYFVCRERVIIQPWLITTHHAKLYELVAKWPAAILTGMWIRRTEPWSRRLFSFYLKSISRYWVISCTSLSISLSGKRHLLRKWRAGSAGRHDRRFVAGYSRREREFAYQIPGLN